jgi:hypothetical protein
MNLDTDVTLISSCMNTCGAVLNVLFYYILCIRVLSHYIELKVTICFNIYFIRLVFLMCNGGCCSACFVIVL